MKIRLEQVGAYTCLPLPGQAATLREFAAGREVEVVWDATRNQMLVRPAANGDAAGAAAPPDGSIAQAVEDFLTQYEDAMRELASL